MTSPAHTDPGASPRDDARQAHVKTSAARLSVGVNVGLLAVKGGVAALTGSVALLASAADSLLDLTASIFAYFGVRVGARPPDDTHAYGHHKFENLSSLVQLGLLLVTVGLVATEAFERLSDGASLTTPAYGIAVIVGSLLVDVWVSRRLSHAAAESGSIALEADALHFSTDVWSNVAVILGLSAASAGFEVADPIAALVVAVLVAVTAVGLLRRTAGGLTDRAPDEETVETLVATIEGFEEVRHYHTLRARLVGPRIFLDVCVELDPHLTFARAHDVSHEMQAALHRAVPRLGDAVIHFEPAGHPGQQDTDHHSHGFDALTAESDE